MPIADRESPRELNSKSAYLAVLYSLPVLFAFAWLGNFYRGLGAAVCCALMILVMMVRWDLRDRWWFWAILLVGAALQVPIVLFVPWGNRGLTGISLLPLGLLDYGIIYGAIRLAERLAKGARS